MQTGSSPIETTIYQRLRAGFTGASFLFLWSYSSNNTQAVPTYLKQENFKIFFKIILTICNLILFVQKAEGRSRTVVLTLRLPPAWFCLYGLVEVMVFATLFNRFHWV